MSKIGQNYFKSNRGWNISKIVVSIISSFLCLTINFDLWFSSVQVRDELDFLKMVWGVKHGLKNDWLSFKSKIRGETSAWSII